MHHHIPLALILLTGCSDPATPATDDSDASNATDAPPTATSEESTHAGSVPTGDPDTGTASGSGHSASQSGTASDTGGTGETSGGAGTGESGDSSDTGDSGDSAATGACMAMDGPAPVELGGPDDLAAPGAYVALAKSAITNVPGTALVGGHVGISPAAESAITGFALTLDASGVYSTSPAVAAPWRVYAADHAVPTPINLTTGVLAMQAAYSDAAGRTPTDYLDLEDGDLGGLTLAPGVYTWGSTVIIPEDVTLAGCDDDVWIFQIAGDLDVSTGKRVLLSGGARARNVFWQVAGAATLRANAHLEGIILGKTGITLQTGASMHGRAFAQTMIAFDANAVTAP